MVRVPAQRRRPAPVPWIRVRLSCALGNALYPDPQWAELRGLWRALYPLGRAPAAMRRPLDRLEAEIPASRALPARSPAARAARARGSATRCACRSRRRHALLARFAAWRDDPAALPHAPPALAFAVLGQARAAGLITPERESAVLGDCSPRGRCAAASTRRCLCARPPSTVPLAIASGLMSRQGDRPVSDQPTFKLSGQPTQPVQAGAIVRLEATTRRRRRGRAGADATVITWHVVGPFSGDVESSRGPRAST